MATLSKEEFDDKGEFEQILDQENADSKIRPRKAGPVPPPLHSNSFKWEYGLKIKRGNKFVAIATAIEASISTPERTNRHVQQTKKRRQEHGSHQVYLVITLESSLIDGEIL